MDRAPTHLFSTLCRAGSAAPSLEQELAQVREQLADRQRRLDEREQELAALRGSHELLLSTLDSADDGVLTLQYSGDSIFYNIRFIELWGIPENKLADMDKKSLAAFQASQVKDSSNLLAHIENLRVNPDIEDLSVIDLKDGRVLERHVLPQRVHGKCVGSVITYRDVTQRLRYEQEMMFNHLVLENSGPMLWLDRASRTLTYANPAACGLLGYALEEVVGMEISDFDLDFHARDLPMLDAALAEAKGAIGLKSRHRCKDGSVRNVEISLFLAEAGERAVYICAVKDVTAQMQAEQEKGGQKALLASLINSIPDAISYRSVDGEYLGCNDAFAQMAGKPAGEIIGRMVREVVPQDRAEWVLQRDAEVLASLQKSTQEISVDYPDGRRALMDTVRTPLRDQNNNLLGVLSISRDMTQRREAEEEIRHAKEAAEEATRMKSDFLANMSHEIRTPMNAIIGLSHLVLKTDLTERQRDYITKVQTSGKHLLALINDILDFSKVEAGKLDLEQADFELQALLDTTGALISEKCHAKGLELVFEVAPDVPPHLVGDSLRLGQVLLNYANNAVKFTEQGAIVISVRASERSERDVLLHFRVQDTGIGLSHEQTGRLFQSFSQADASTTRKFGGTGLGLAISKQLAGLMGGEVGVESELGLGSSFWFSARLGVGAAPSRQLVPRPDLRGRRALVVDDSDPARAVMVEMLRSMTFHTTEVASGAAAVAEVARAARAGLPYDVVYLDWRMPGMDGMQTARRIGSMGLASPPMFLMVTAYGREEVMKEAQSAGISDVLVKPVNASVLFDATMGVLGSREAPAAEGAQESGAADLRLPLVRGARILLVEDNDINQQVARELLEDVGAVVDVAGNGAIALDMAQRNAYDLVFMDMQMPVMDGVAATREMRRLASLRSLPIVAMTANAMEQDRRKCLDAGMNDFLVKPIDPEAMTTLLLRWARPRRVPARAPDAQRANAPSAAEPVLPLDIPGLDVPLGLSRMMGKKSLYLAMLGRYCVGQANLVRDIWQAWDSGERETAQRLAHTAKAVSGNVGATLVQECATLLEDAMRDERDDAQIARLVSELETPLAQLLAALQAFLPPPADQPQTEAEERSR